MNWYHTGLWAKCSLQAMVLSASCASGAMLTIGISGGLEGVWQSLAILQTSRGITLGGRFWLLKSPLSVSGCGRSKDQNTHHEQK